MRCTKRAGSCAYEHYLDITCAIHRIAAAQRKGQLPPELCAWSRDPSLPVRPYARVGAIGERL